MKVLVTGGAGFVGSNIVRKLAEGGHVVYAVDNLSTGYQKNLDEIDELVQFVQGDILDYDLMEELCSEVELVFHQAALPSVPRSVENPWETNNHNVNGTLSVFLAARNSGVSRVVYAASSSAYGNNQELPKKESMCAEPLSPYAVSKHVGELYGSVFSDTYDIDAVGLRYFNVFGPRQDPSSEYAAVIPKFIDHFYRGEPPIIYGDGEQTRDFTFVDNVVQANLGAAFAPADNVSGKVFNVGCGERITINKLAQEIKKIVESNINPKHEDPRPGDVRHSQADISKAHKAFGYEPRVGLKEGLRRTVEWLEREREVLT